MKRLKKALSLLTCLAMTAGLAVIPNTALAAGAGETAEAESWVEVGSETELRDAIANAKTNGGHIKLKNGFELNERIIINNDNASDATIVIDFGGYTISSDDTIFDNYTSNLTVQNGNIVTGWNGVWNQATCYVKNMNIDASKGQRRACK